jgi:hypothetical protein
MTPQERAARPGSERLMTVAEVAEYLRMSTVWVRRHAGGVRQPTIPSIRLGKAVRVPCFRYRGFPGRMPATIRNAQTRSLIRRDRVIRGRLHLRGGVHLLKPKQLSSQGEPEA